MTDVLPSVAVLSAMLGAPSGADLQGWNGGDMCAGARQVSALIWCSCYSVRIGFIIHVCIYHVFFILDDNDGDVFVSQMSFLDPLRCLSL